MRLTRGKWERSGTLRLFPVPQPGRRIHRQDRMGAGRDADLRHMNLTPVAGIPHSLTVGDWYPRHEFPSVRFTQPIEPYESTSPPTDFSPSKLVDNKGSISLAR